MSRISLAVLNIGWTCTKHDLRSYFSKFGKVHAVRIPMNDFGFNQRMAHITMSGDKGFESGILKDYHTIDGYEVNVQLQQDHTTKNVAVTIIRKLNTFI